jgi:hypothetical protein
MPPHLRRPLRRSVLAASLALAGVVSAGCAGEDDDNPLAPNSPLDLPDIRGSDDLPDVYSGELDAAFAEDLPAYVEAEVTLLTAVADVVTPRIFTVTSPDGSDVEPVLVIATEEAADEEPSSGEQLVIAATPADELQPETVVEEMGLSVDAEELEEWDDETYLVATVIEPAS